MKVLAKEPKSFREASLIDCFENNFMVACYTWFLEIFENQSYEIYKAQIRTDKVFWCHLKYLLEQHWFFPSWSDGSAR
jgi:hypothetical protein